MTSTIRHTEVWLADSSGIGCNIDLSTRSAVTIHYRGHAFDLRLGGRYSEYSVEFQKAWFDVIVEFFCRDTQKSRCRQELHDMLSRFSACYFTSGEINPTAYQAFLHAVKILDQPGGMAQLRRVNWTWLETIGVPREHIDMIKKRRAAPIIVANARRYLESKRQILRKNVRDRLGNVHYTACGDPTKKYILFRDKHQLATGYRKCDRGVRLALPEGQLKSRGGGTYKELVRKDQFWVQLRLRRDSWLRDTPERWQTALDPLRLPSHYFTYAIAPDTLIARNAGEPIFSISKIDRNTEKLQRNKGLTFPLEVFKTVLCETKYLNEQGIFNFDFKDENLVCRIESDGPGQTRCVRINVIDCDADSLFFLSLSTRKEFSKTAAPWFLNEGNIRGNIDRKLARLWQTYVLILTIVRIDAVQNLEADDGIELFKLYEKFFEHAITSCLDAHQPRDQVVSDRIVQWINVHIKDDGHRRIFTQLMTGNVRQLKDAPDVIPHLYDALWPQ